MTDVNNPIPLINDTSSLTLFDDDRVLKWSILKSMVVLRLLVYRASP